MHAQIDIAELVGWFLELSQGQCSVTEERIAAEADPRRADVLAGLLMLHEELEYREALSRQAAAETRAALQRAAAAQRLEAIGQLSAGVAHEINTPVQFVGDNTQFVRDGLARLLGVLEAQERVVAAVLGGEDARGAAEAVRLLEKKSRAAYLREQLPVALNDSVEGLDRIAKIVRAMKEISHPSQGQREKVDLAAVLRSCVMVTRHEWKLVAEVELDFDDEVPLVECMRDEVTQVFVNLLVNAGHALSDARRGPDEGRIVVGLRSVGTQVELTLADNGPGVPEEIRARIFEQFFTTKEVGRGTGQGLSLAHAIVQRHGGQLRLEETPGGGATFRITLPITPQSEETAGSGRIEGERVATAALGI